MSQAGDGDRPLSIVIITGEHSGDALGGKLMAALKAAWAGPIRFAGVGGEAMAAQGLETVFPLADVAVMGPIAIVKRLPRLVRRVYRAVDVALAADPDVVVIIDAPEFTHPIAKRIRRRRPDVPIIDYVSPSVWAWRPGRARKMARYVDHVLALLPFEPEVHRRLGGPPCTYVGHPLIEQLDTLRAQDTAAFAARHGLDPARPLLVVLPGSRSTEVGRLMAPFGGAVGLLRARMPSLQVVIPTVPSVRALVETGLTQWSMRPLVIEGDADKFAAFRLARAALAASGTVTLELAVAGTPMVVAYRVDRVASHLRFMLKVPSIVLANLVLGENAFPELLQEECVAASLAAAVSPLLSDTPGRAAQLAALARVPARMALPAGSPSEAAAEVVMGYVKRGRSADRPD